MTAHEPPRPAAAPAAAATPLSDDEMALLEQCLDRVPAPLEPLDLMMLDGYLCGVLLQPSRVPEAQWMRHVTDVDGRPIPDGVDLGPLAALVRRRHAELDRAIADRQWFDPWVFELDEDDDPMEAVMPWAAGFATAMEFFPALSRLDEAQVLEPMAVIYRAFDPDDLEDADAMLAVIEELEPPQDLAEAVESLVSSTLLLADVSRPQKAAKPFKPQRPTGRAGGARGASRPGAPRAVGGGHGAARPGGQRGKPGPKR